MVAKPFIKWAGGKSQLLDAIRTFYPAQLKRGDVRRYVEPFLGGGAVLLDVLQNYHLDEAYVFDVNEDLVDTYIVVRDNVSNLIKKLSEIERDFLALDNDERKKYYLNIRELYNQRNSDDVEHAAHFIFLNKVCFNGLYRVNSGGQFNVPYGSYKNPKICDEYNLRAVSKLLANVHIFASSFEDSSMFIDSSTFVYFDPPYRPISNTSNFISYSADKFDDELQIELADFFRSMSERGALLMLSNSNSSDNFFQNLYSDFNIHEVMARRSINSKANGRGLVTELLITNYQIVDGGTLYDHCI